MNNIRRGLGEKMEDRAERIHQDGMHEWQQFHTVKYPEIRARARENVHV